MTIKQFRILQSTIMVNWIYFINCNINKLKKKDYQMCRNFGTLLQRELNHGRITYVLYNF